MIDNPYWAGKLLIIACHTDSTLVRFLFFLQFIFYLSLNLSLYHTFCISLSFFHTHSFILSLPFISFSLSLSLTFLLTFLLSFFLSLSFPFYLFLECTTYVSKENSKRIRMLDRCSSLNKMIGNGEKK